MAEERIIVNGVNASTGGYLSQPTAQDIEKVAVGQLVEASSIHDKRSSDLNPSAEKQHVRELQKRKEKGEDHYGVAEGIDEKDLAQTGWGIIFAGEDPHASAIREALSELLEHRKKQATAKNEKFYKEFQGRAGYRKDDSKSDFISRHGGSPGAVDPKNGIPYYLLIIGDPDTIPYEFQYQLDVQYAVGRLSFDGENQQEILDQYRAYARSVVDAETRHPFLPRKASFFGVQNENDKATELSSQKLVTPLASLITDDQKTNGWDIGSPILAEDATRNRLQQLIGGEETPAFLFAASHGVAFDNGDSKQIPHQGALLCSDWPGPSWREPIPEDFYFAGDHINSNANFFGLIAFFFACYGAGTPQMNDFFHHDFHDTPDSIAPRSFIANLPRKMLSHPQGGALAVVGHVDRAWGGAYLGKANNPQVGTFRDTIKRLLEGHPIGSAMEPFNQRYAEIASDLTLQIFKMEYQMYHPAGIEYTIADMWTNNHDARNYMVIGDPAVRLPVVDTGAASTDRPTIDMTTNISSRAPVQQSTPVQAQPVVEKPSDDTATLSNDEWKQRLSNLKETLTQALKEIEELERKL